jgi:hypothetical protein
MTFGSDLTSVIGLLIYVLGTIMGVYATNNGGQGETPAYFSRWRYHQVAQKIDHDTWIPV